MTEFDTGQTQSLQDVQQPRTSKKNKKNIHYSVFWHTFWIWVYMIVFVCLLVFAMSWVIGGVEKAFRSCNIWKDPSTQCETTQNSDCTQDENDESKKDDEKYLNIGVLPDFLGGLVGVVAGFLIEIIFIQRLRHLKKYQALCHSFYHIFKDLEENINYNLGELNKPELKLKELKAEIFTESINSVENDYIFYGLPRYFGLLKIGPDVKAIRLIYTSIHAINSALNEYRNDLNACEQDKILQQQQVMNFEKHLKVMKKEIELFRSYTKMQSRY